MSIREKLDIAIITYNRKEFLQKTLEQIFAPNSPIKDFDITVLNNSSTDGTTELVNEYCSKYPNLKQVINRVNIGGCANIAKAFTEIPEKEYIWVLCDNDTYDWSCWNDVEDAVSKQYDSIMLRNCKPNASDIFYTSTLVSACIYRTDLITYTTAENIYDFIKFLFPHLALAAQVINNEKSMYIVKKDIVHSGVNPEHDTTFTRGTVLEDMSESRRNIFWSVGYFNSVELIRDKELRTEIIEGVRHYHKSLFDLFKTVMVKNKVLHNNYLYNLQQIFRVLNFKQKLKFLFAFLVINLSLKNYDFYEIRSKKQWEKYFELVEEQKHLDRLAQKYSGKRVLIYGAGMIAEELIENYDFSKFNIIGISDKRYERTEEGTFCGVSTIKPAELKNKDFDVILFSLKLHTGAYAALKASGINKKADSLIKKSFKYPIRF